jgi:hypothetical protein
MFPSGASQDRRAWVQLKAYAGETLLLESGVVPADGAVVDLVGVDEHLWLLRDRGLDEGGEEAHMFWEIATVESELLPPATTLDQSDPAFDHSVRHTYPLEAGTPDRIELVLHIQAIGRDVLDDLIDSGDLAEVYRDAFPTFTPESGTFTWTLDAAGEDRCLPN